MPNVTMFWNVAKSFGEKWCLFKFELQLKKKFPTYKCLLLTHSSIWIHNKIHNKIHLAQEGMYNDVQHTDFSIELYWSIIHRHTHILSSVTNLLAVITSLVRMCAFYNSFTAQIQTWMETIIAITPMKQYEMGIFLWNVNFFYKL